MRPVVSATMTLFLAVGSVWAQDGRIGIFADPYGDDVCLSDRGARACSFYIVHVLTPGASASQFAVPQPSCFQATYLSDTRVFPVGIGNSQTGIAIGYGSCLSGPIHVLTVNFFCNGLTRSCCQYSVVPDPNLPSRRIEGVNCSNAIVYPIGGSAMINESPPECSCAFGDLDSTWGKVKSLYGD